MICAKKVCSNTNLRIQRLKHKHSSIYLPLLILQSYIQRHDITILSSSLHIRMPRTMVKDKTLNLENKINELRNFTIQEGSIQYAKLCSLEFTPKKK